MNGHVERGKDVQMMVLFGEWRCSYDGAVW